MLSTIDIITTITLSADAQLVSEASRLATVFARFPRTVCSLAHGFRYGGSVVGHISSKPSKLLFHLREVHVAWIDIVGLDDVEEF